MNYYKQLKDKILNKEAYDKIKDYSKERNTVITYYEIGEILHQAGKHYGEGIIQKYADSLEKDFGKKYNKRSLFRMRQFYLIFSEPKWASVRPESQKVVSPEDLSLKLLYNRDYLDRKVVSPSSQEQKVVSPENLSLNTLNNKDYSKQKVVSLDEIGSPCPLIITKLTWTHYRFILPIRDDNERYYYIKTAIINHLSVRELRDRIKSKEYQLCLMQTSYNALAHHNILHLRLFYGI